MNEFKIKEVGKKSWGDKLFYLNNSTRKEFRKVLEFCRIEKKFPPSGALI